MTKLPVIVIHGVCIQQYANENSIEYFELIETGINLPYLCFTIACGKAELNCVLRC